MSQNTHHILANLMLSQFSPKQSQPLPVQGTINPFLISTTINPSLLNQQFFLQVKQPEHSDLDKQIIQNALNQCDETLIKKLKPNSERIAPFLFQEHDFLKIPLPPLNSLHPLNNFSNLIPVNNPHPLESLADKPSMISNDESLKINPLFLQSALHHQPSPEALFHNAFRAHDVSDKPIETRVSLQHGDGLESLTKEMKLTSNPSPVARKVAKIRFLADPDVEEAEEARPKQTKSQRREMREEELIAALEEDEFSDQEKKRDRNYVPKLSRASRLKALEIQRKQPERKKKDDIKSPSSGALQDVMTITPELTELLGYDQFDLEKLFALWIRSDKNKQKFFVKLKRNLSYYKKTLRLNS